MARLDYNEDEKALFAEADGLELQAKAKREEANDRKRQRELARPLQERLVYAAVERCPCGHGMAYDPTGVVRTESGSPHVIRPDQWECAGTLLWRAGQLDNAEAGRMLTATHQSPLPFTFWELKSEDQPSANGRTTREPVIPSNDAEQGAGQ